MRSIASTNDSARRRRARTARSLHAAVVEQLPTERAANDAYLAHTSDCLACDPGAGRLCVMGTKLHRRWARAMDAERAQAPEVTP